VKRVVASLWGAAALLWVVYISMCVAQERHPDSSGAAQDVALQDTALSTAPDTAAAGVADAADGSRQKAGPSAVSPAEGDCINVNAGDTTDLVQLPGIGPVIARRVVALREARGPYGDAQALLEVKGIGPKRLEAIEPLICF